jgi:hypothetical protein
MTRTSVDIKLIILVLPQETTPCFECFIMVGVFLRKQSKIVTMKHSKHGVVSCGRTSIINLISTEVLVMIGART